MPIGKCFDGYEHVGGIARPLLSAVAFSPLARPLVIQCGAVFWAVLRGVPASEHLVVGDAAKPIRTGKELGVRMEIRSLSFNRLSDDSMHPLQK